MRRATSVKPAGTWNPADAIDCVCLDADARVRRRIMLQGEQGTAFLLDLAEVPALREDDGLVLEDGALVRVRGESEPLAEIEAASPELRLRVAWHLGNRHTAVEVYGERLRMRRDHVLETMLRDLGAHISHVEAPFYPEGGAYAHHRDHGPGEDHARAHPQRHGAHLHAGRDHDGH